MTDRSNQKPGSRRRFITSALVGGAGSLLAGNVALAVTDEESEACNELTAADPLYIYTSLVHKLQPSAISEGRKFEAAVQASQAEKLAQLGALSDRLRSLLPRKTSAHASLERMKSLAYIGRTNVEALDSLNVLRSRKSLRAHAQSENLIVGEIAKTSEALADVKLSGEAWNVLQELLKKIDEIRSFQPKVNQAREDFNKLIQTINQQISGIQSALMEASSSIVKEDKALAATRVKEAIAIVKQLPGYNPNWKPDPNKIISKQEAETLTPNKFIALLDPGVLQLIEKGSVTTGSIRPGKPLRRVTMTPAVYVSELSETSNPFPQLQTVKAIVKEFLVSGTWWQVVAVAAVCLPLWSYPRGEQRKSLIYSALAAIPRGPNSDLWKAAHYLNQLRP